MCCKFGLACTCAFCYLVRERAEGLVDRPWAVALLLGPILWAVFAGKPWAVAYWASSSRDFLSIASAASYQAVIISLLCNNAETCEAIYFQKALFFFLRLYDGSTCTYTTTHAAPNSHPAYRPLTHTPKEGNQQHILDLTKIR